MLGRSWQFYAPMPCMIWVACIVELAIDDWSDFFILLSLQMINASVSFYEAAQAVRASGRYGPRPTPAVFPVRTRFWPLAEGRCSAPRCS